MLGELYIGKTDRCILIRMEEHGTRNDQPMHILIVIIFDNYFRNCSLFTPLMLCLDNLRDKWSLISTMNFVVLFLLLKMTQLSKYAEL